MRNFHGLLYYLEKFRLTLNKIKYIKNFLLNIYFLEKLQERKFYSHRLKKLSYDIYIIGSGIISNA